MSRIAACWIASACISLAACQYSPEAVERAISYNQAVADSTNKLLFLNTLRARDRYPTYYSRITSDTANSIFSPSASVSVPLGPGAVKKGFSPTFSVGSTEQNQLTLQNLDDQKFMRGILSPLSVDVLGFYLRQGWPAEVLLMLTISKITTTANSVDELIAAFDQQCRSDPNNDYCNAQVPPDAPMSSGGQYITQQLSACIKDSRQFTRAGSDSIVLENYPTNPMHTHCFQWMLRVLIALDPVPQQEDAFEVLATNITDAKETSLSTITELEKANLVLAPMGNTSVVCKRRTLSGIALSRFMRVGQASAAKLDDASDDKAISLLPRLTLPATEACAAAARAGRTSPSPQVQFTTRSLDGMIYYLGEVLRAGEAAATGAELGGTDVFESVTVWTWNPFIGRYVDSDIFVASKGSAPPASSISVEYGGGTYFIPPSCDDLQVCHGGLELHRSLQVLALLSQVWGLQKEQSEPPIVPTITVVNP